MSNLEICQKAVKLALKLGASDAVCSISTEDSTEVSAFKGKSEGLEGGNSLGMGVKVYMGQKVGSFSINDLSDESIDDAVRNALALAKLSPENEFEGVADRSLVQNVSAEMLNQLDRIDNTEAFTPDEMLRLACEMEEAALAVATVQSTRSSSVSHSKGSSTLVISNGFEAESHYTVSSAMIEAIASNGSIKTTDYDYHTAFHKADLDSVLLIGKKAGEKSAAKLNQVSMPKMGKVPVLFKPEMSARLLLGAVSSCLSGSTIFAKQSFMTTDDIGKQLFGKNICLLDNRVRPRGLGSAAYTGDGIVGPESVHFIKDGVLENLTFGVLSGRKLGLSPEMGRDGMYNAYLKPGDLSVNELIFDIKLGFYLTSIMGHGFKSITGDMSYTVEGFIIRDGVITKEFVNEATMAGNLKDMLNNVTFANDLNFRYGSNAPTARVEGLTIG